MAPESKPTAGSSDHPSCPASVSSSDLWVGNIPTDSSPSDLMAMFSDFFPLDATISNAARPFAFLYFKSADTARAAKDSLSGSKTRGKPLKIDFARPAKPSPHIWIGGLSASVTETLLKENLSKFGQIKEFALVRERNSAFVDFGTIKEAASAKKEMDGKQVSDAEIHVDFQRPFQYQKPNRRPPLPPPLPPPPASAPGRRDEVPSNTLWIGYPPSVRMDTQRLHNAMILFGEIERIKSFPERHNCFVDFRSIDEARRAKEGLQGRLFGDPRIHILFSRSDFAPGKDTAPLLPGFPGMRLESTFDSMGHLHPPRMPVTNTMMRPYLPQGFNPDFGGPNWRRPFPRPGLIPSSLEFRSSNRPIWDDGFDTREPKRLRYFGSPAYDEPFHGRSLDDEPVRFPSRARGSPEIDDVWRGIIAKGGSHVCHARCVPIGRGLDFPLPEVVNCSARTDLDLLAKRYFESFGFDIVFFLPDSEADFSSYTEFLQYLGLNSRAGVARFDDGATMFLVPPSDFLTEVLKVSGPERLYGVVLKLPQHQQRRSVTPQRSHSAALPPPHNVEQQMGSIIQDGYGHTQNEGPDLRMDHGSSMHENSIPSAGDREPHADVSRVMPPASHDYRRNLDGTSQIGVTLTPELIATLASLVPSNNQSSVAGNIQTHFSSTVKSSSFPSAVMNDSPVSVQGWSQGRQGSYPGAQLETTNSSHQESQQLQKLGDQLLLQHQLEEYNQQCSNQPPDMPKNPAYGSLITLTDNAGQTFLGSAQGQDPALNLVRASYESYDTRETLGAPGGGVAFSQQLQYQSAPVNSSVDGQTRRVLQNHMGLSSSTNDANYSPQMQQFQIAFNNFGGGPSEGSADQNQRYEATLQIAATMLQQIQREQQGGSRTVDGSGN